MGSPSGTPPVPTASAPSTAKAAWWLASVAIGLSVALLIAVLLEWSGPVVVVLALFVVFFAPGLACRVVFGQPLVDLVDVAMTVAVSLGATILLGLWLNAIRVSLTRPHWAEALTALVSSTAAAGLVIKPAWPPATARQCRPQPDRVRLAIAAACLGVGALGAGIVAWVSQQHWLSGQHFTELYVHPTAGSERVFVHNHEGRSARYRAVIQAAGSPPSVVQFSLASDGTWIDDVFVRRGAVGPGVPLLRVLLFRGNGSTAYRQIRLP